MNDISFKSEYDEEFESARLEHVRILFELEAGRAKSLEAKAGFFLTLISIFLGGIIIEIDVVTLMLASQTGQISKLVLLVSTMLVLLALVGSLLAILNTMRLRDYSNPSTSKPTDSLFSPDSPLIGNSNKAEFVRQSALSFAVSLERNKAVNDRKAKDLKLVSVLTLLSVLASLLLISVYLFAPYI